MHILLLAAPCLLPVPPARLQVPAAQQQAALDQAGLEALAKEIQKDVEKLRGTAFPKPVAVKLAGQAEFLAYAKRRQQETESAGRLRRDSALAQLLGLVPGGVDLEALTMGILEKQVGGFYDPSSSTFYLMSGFSGGVAKVILSHELAHALDDQLFDLDGTAKRFDEETDRELAWRCVVEGSGTSTMNQWFLAHRSAVDPVDLAKAQSLGGPELAAAPPYVWKPLVGSYLRGEGFLVRQEGLNLLMARPKPADLELALKNPPRSTEQVLHPAAYWDEAKRDEPTRLEFAAAPAGWKVEGRDVYGELMLALLATPPAKRTGLDVANPASILAVEYTNAAATGWDGDRVLWLSQDGADAAVVASVWDSTKDADEFAAAARAGLVAQSEARGLAPRGVLVERRGEREVLLVACTKALAADELRALAPAWTTVEPAAAPAKQ